MGHAISHALPMAPAIHVKADATSFHPHPGVPVDAWPRRLKTSAAIGRDAEIPIRFLSFSKLLCVWWLEFHKDTKWFG